MSNGPTPFQLHPAHVHLILYSKHKHTLLTTFVDLRAGNSFTTSETNGRSLVIHSRRLANVFSISSLISTWFRLFRLFLNSCLRLAIAWWYSSTDISDVSLMLESNFRRLEGGWGQPFLPLDGLLGCAFSSGQSDRLLPWSLLNKTYKDVAKEVQYSKQTRSKDSKFQRGDTTECNWYVYQRSNLLTYMATSKGILQAFELHHQLATDSVILLRSWIFCVLNHVCEAFALFLDGHVWTQSLCLYFSAHPMKVSRSGIWKVWRHLDTSQGPFTGSVRTTAFMSWREYFDVC